MGVLFLLLGPPVAFAFALGLLDASTKRHWLYAVVGIAFLHALAVVAAGPSELLPVMVVISVLAPWLAVAVFLALSSFPRHAVLNAFVVPVVFAVVFFGGLVLGVNIGHFPL